MEQLQKDKKAIQGLTEREAVQRKRNGLANGNFSVKTKSIGQIISSNVFTLFNFLNVFLAGCLFFVHSYKNMLFLGVVLSNILIGVVQEIRSKCTIDRLSLLSEPEVEVIRDGILKKIQIEDIVLDDVFLLKNGSQVCVDGMILEGECEVNESLLTGESDPVYKKEGDEILSGSFLISGNVTAQALHVGKDSYVNKITGQAKYLKKPNSEMLKSIKMIIKIISAALIPIMALLFYNQMSIDGAELSEAVVATVAAVIGMIPSGLVLLTSMVLAVSVVRLGKKQTLVQELYCIETLARVDTLCLDKTGTITEGVMDVDGIEIIDEHFKKEEIDEILHFFTSGLNDDNPTFLALREYSKDWCEEERVQNYQVRSAIHFSSDKKWSLVDFEKQGCYCIGAMEFVLPDANEDLRKKALRFAGDGVRVLLLAHSEQHCDKKHLPEGLRPYAFILLTDRIRENAPETIRYFKNQGVDIKVISGDHPRTVANIAKRAGLDNTESYVDATSLHSDADIEEAAKKYTIFGRVTPSQKLKLVQALKRGGHTVAMTGDGVNDVMALKEADCSIAMQSGSDAARNVSQLVLIDSDFSSMPHIVAEGRRTINNIQRSAALYLTKTIYSAILAIIFIIVNMSYPFQPIQQTLIGGLTIGIPSFILALEPNLNRVKGNFLMNVLKLAIPGGLLVVTNVVVMEILGSLFGMGETEGATLAFFGLAIASLVELFKVCKPFNKLRMVMCFVLMSVFGVCVVFFGGFFELGRLSFMGVIVVLAFLASTPPLHMAYSIITDKLMGNTPNVYDIYPVFVTGKEETKKVILVDEDVDVKDYHDVGAQFMGLRVLRTNTVGYIGKSECAHIRADSWEKERDDMILAAAARCYVRKLPRRARAEYVEVMVETFGEAPVKVCVDLKNHKVIIENGEEEYRVRMLKRIKITL